jgi:signal transduction histidine kinase
VSFKVSARTVLELGAELISSDAVAIFELVKNAIDAGSRSGVELRFCITLTYSAYVELLSQIDREDESVDDLKAAVLKRCQSSAKSEMLQLLQQLMSKARTHKQLRAALEAAYAATCWIEVRDTGLGMTKDDLLTRYLVIGTPSRKREIDATARAIAEGKEEASTPPYLGEKGVGRLSAMRLGNVLRIETATEKDKKLNVLEVDWRAFEDLSLMIEDIKITPAVGGEKTTASWSGTNIRISELTGNWGTVRIRDVVNKELARLVDPFVTTKKRFRIAVFFNDERIDIPRMNDELLREAHSSAKASYELVEDEDTGLTEPRLHVELMYRVPTEDKKAISKRIETKTLTLGRSELTTVLDDADDSVPESALTTVGPFKLEVYWYNRRLLTKIDTIGDLKTVRELQERWAGIMLFRDGYRVFPYGEVDDDWLRLDRKALASGGYKLNKQQFVGRAQISRFENPQLIDQTNREGLKDCPEKEVFIELLRYVLHSLLKGFMDDVDDEQRRLKAHAETLEKRMVTLEGRAKDAIRALTKKHRESNVELRDVLGLFEEMKEQFEQARALSEQADVDRTRLVQLAGVGLMLEVVAHELARSTEHALAALGNAESDELPEHVNAALRSLRREMKTIHKRLRVLDPLSVSARQRKETFDFAALVQDSLDGRSPELERQGIKVDVTFTRGKQLMVVGVKGMFVQIIENILSNSMYWLERRKKEQSLFKPKITIEFDPPRKEVRFTDNGPGISPQLREDVFKPFFSTKGKNRRQGLGLYIARDCAEHNGSTLDLSEERSVHKDRLNTFVLAIGDAD